MKQLAALIEHWLRNLRRTNLPLLLGLILTLGVVALAIWGHRLAPHDPLQTNYTLDYGEGIRTPPYPPFRMIDYPLGTDQFGRDLLSRILWGVRPTMIVVVSVAAVRLALALIIGLLAGWSTGVRGRALDGLISAALSVPVLFVALAGITLYGLDKGLAAFVLGLSLTGWADTARLVSAQTRAIKKQTYVEAAHVLGSSTPRILIFHILPHVMPLVWMLMSLELGATLLVVAQLGFLGFFIGGGVWIDIFDFVQVNTAGLPELGQMLSQALVKLTDPAALLVVGSALFIMILGFNLLGEGLRLELMPERMRHRNVLPAVVRLTEWWHFTAFPSIEDFITRRQRALAISTALVLAAAIGWGIWETRPAAPLQAAPGMEVPGLHLWAAERHDAQGTRFAPVSGPSAPQILWSVSHPPGFSGGPVVRSDGIIIIAGVDKQLLAFEPDGRLLWQKELAEEPVGTPALDASGGIYVADKKGGLSYIPFDENARPGWRYQPQPTREATSGPVVARNGNIYYTVIDKVQAVSPLGKGLWRNGDTSNYLYLVPRLSPMESFVFLQDKVFGAGAGGLQDTSGLFLTADPQLLYSAPEFFVGPNRRTYLRVGHGAYQWRPSDSGMVVERTTMRAKIPQFAFYPFDAGAAPNGSIWLLYTSDYSTVELIWLNELTGVELGVYKSPTYSAKLIAIDQGGLAYLCGDTGLRIECAATDQNGNPKWTLIAGDGSRVTGGALITGRLYISTASGLLAALGDIP